ncbi:hypothetical protein [Desulfovibrio sp. X2]|uniref:hypothetical protein n=1 Tax=Desulfovibrio sp. X2 TaxID=941449 RepID=UPI00155A5932|nr:hypothetical protein [Desulfovibrio sp. X2]
MTKQKADYLTVYQTASGDAILLEALEQAASSSHGADSSMIILLDTRKDVFCSAEGT